MAATTVGDVTAGPGTSGHRGRVWSTTRRWWPLLVLLAVGVALRATVALAPLPDNHHPDESRNLNAAAAMAREGTLDYSSFSTHMSYPALMYNIGALSFLTWAKWMELTGSEDPLQREPFQIQTPASARSANPSAVVAMRAPFVLLSGATILLAAALTHHICRRRSISCLAGGLVALSSVDIELGGSFTPDPATGALNTAVLLGAVWIVRRPSMAAYVASGALVGVAVSAKYSGVLVASAVALGHLLATAGRPWQQLGRLGAAAGTSVVAFALVSPITFLDWETAWTWIEIEQDHYRTGHPGWEGGVPAYYARTLFRMFGPSILLVPLSLVWARRNRSTAPLPAIGFVGIYLVVHLLYIVRFERFMLALTGAIAVLAALGLHLLLERVPRPSRALAPALVTLTLVVPAGMAAATMARAFQDPWAEAGRWIEQHIEPGTAIAVESVAPWVDPERYEVHAPLRFIDIPEGGWAERDVAFFVSAAAQYQRYDPRRYPDEHTAYRRLLAGLCEEESFHGANHTVTIFRADPC